MKIICTDYDGTLNHGGITEEKLAAIEKWKKKGNIFCVVSGRQKEFFEEIRKKNIPIDYLLACNGGVIVDKDYNVVSDVRCDGAVAKPLINYLFSLGVFSAAICNDSHERIENPAVSDAKGPLLSETGEIAYFNQISTALPDFAAAAEATAKIRKNFGAFVNPLQNGTCIDIVPRGMDKAQGIYRLLSLTGGKKTDVIAVGDNINDEAMIREFYSYAMENGVDSIKRLADKRTCSIEELIEKEL